ncbi:hypothetical protein NQ318_019853 [Aromia moschata]|uniref:RRM domain-containing protein n=1 Tax=Aromia moschata TaxID=1265417 RepID=A0AAV8YMM0_9CUCU|nr:hypothetical protein NQ318_019853 [Aromia moschata]
MVGRIVVLFKPLIHSFSIYLQHSQTKRRLPGPQSDEQETTDPHSLTGETNVPLKLSIVKKYPHYFICCIVICEFVSYMTTTAKIPPITMSKLYVGNLPNETSESALRQLFLEQNLSCTSILVKRGGYAFVDCPDQSSADRAIDKLNDLGNQ